MITERTRIVRLKDSIDPLDLIEWLEEQGYDPEARVNSKGEISLRGGILDVYPPTSPWPVRIEFFGDEVESIRQFDPVSQISREQVHSVTIPPAGEIGILSRMMQEPGVKPEKLKLGSFIDHLPSDSLIILCNPPLLEEHAGTYAGRIPEDDPFFLGWDSVRQEIANRGMATLEISELDPAADNQDFEVSPAVESGIAENPMAPDSGELALALSNLDAFRPIAQRLLDPQIVEAQRREFFAQLHRWLRQDYAVHVFCNNDGERQRFNEIWEEYGLASSVTLTAPTSPRPSPSVQRAEREEQPRSGGDAGDDAVAASTSNAHLQTHLGALARGFLSHEAKLVVVTDAEIFGRYKVQRPRRLKSPHAVAARSALDIDFTDLAEGDFVVHLQHGIGRYLGLQMMPSTPKRRDAAPAPSPQTPDTTGGQECLVIEYAAGEIGQPAPKLYVPVTESHLVSKYVGAGKAQPALNTLGGTRWAKTKIQAEEAVRDLAAELLTIQAARESQTGHAFPQDAPWQREFESAFLYEETPDQMRAIVQAKADMESPKPMDRLICGDVGYGKTEVAIRAAFKAVMGGRQVALLVPTTVLAQQHFNTFRERMADYPIRIEQLSRFRTRREQQQVLEELAAGAVDIVIGTHRLIQEDVQFKDLGLVVIDEEQRFGVLHKEKFKMLRQMVDVLTLSATPIPRTLYLALTGARDMSTIETPPQDRLPVETIVTQYDERLIRDAIQRELNREGQVFFLHNRVGDIDTVALRIKALVPKARVLVGHGQMGSDDLEEIMTKFVNGEADVLVSTTIIESGIDIPNANTIIIDRADRFGLSDLYQLRGRVGRYKHQAYAYLLLPRHAQLLSDVRKRISAIKQYSSLGSGFKIAMRDLEIRGAGNLLGAQQSGHITAVGFELYCQLLKQSVSALKGEKVKPRVEVQVRLDFLAMRPGGEGGKNSKFQAPSSKSNRNQPLINIPREIASYVGDPSDDSESAIPSSQPSVPPAAAYIPLKYISEPHQRIEIYRKLAGVADKAGLDALRAELRDRFGKLPPGVELLLQVSELKSLASERGVSVIESKDDKLMLTRHGDFIMMGGKFPRLTKKEAKGRLGEIKKLLLTL
ncbi:MAG: transcription-repair coupling factor [Pedosphaera sp.]|nr:transcription-repair coupling factor [Pedosphaera sp.]